VDPRRYPYHRSNLPKALRAAARAILDEPGPNVVGLRETARRVGVSAAAAYRHFSNKEDLLVSVATEGFRELAAAMETGAIESEPFCAVGLAYVDFALQKRGLFRLMFGPILLQRAKYPELDEAARAVFGLLQRVSVSVDEQPREDHVAGMAAWGLVHGLSSLFIDGLFPETYARGMANAILVQRPRPFSPSGPTTAQSQVNGTSGGPALRTNAKQREEIPISSDDGRATPLLSQRSTTGTNSPATPLSSVDERSSQSRKRTIMGRYVFDDELKPGARWKRRLLGAR
jgi:AcrR family transcriptional regulator